MRMGAAGDRPQGSMLTPPYPITLIRPGSARVYLCPMRFYAFLLIWCIIVTQTLCAQREITPTDSIRVSGLIAPTQVLLLSELEKRPQILIPDLVIHNHRGEIKDTLRGLTGVSLRDWMLSMEIPFEKPRDLNKCYLLLKASDGYTALISWNELFNTEAGKQMYLLTSIGGKPISGLPQRMAFIAAGDVQKGRRYVKGLASIEVGMMP
jgi:hypothetical protein